MTSRKVQMKWRNNLHRELRSSDRVVREVNRRANQIAQGARQAAPDGAANGWVDEVKVSGGRGRARTIVSTIHARRAEGHPRSVHPKHLLAGIRAARG